MAAKGAVRNKGTKNEEMGGEEKEACGESRREWSLEGA